MTRRLLLQQSDTTEEVKPMKALRPNFWKVLSESGLGMYSWRVLKVKNHGKLGVVEKVNICKMGKRNWAREEWNLRTVRQGLQSRWQGLRGKGRVDHQRRFFRAGRAGPLHPQLEA